MTSWHSDREFNHKASIDDHKTVFPTHLRILWLFRVQICIPWYNVNESAADVVKWSNLSSESFIELWIISLSLVIIMLRYLVSSRIRSHTPNTMHPSFRICIKYIGDKIPMTFSQECIVSSHYQWLCSKGSFSFFTLRLQMPQIELKWKTCRLEKYYNFIGSVRCAVYPICTDGHYEDLKWYITVTS